MTSLKMFVMLLTTFCLWSENGGSAPPESDCEECCIPNLSDDSSCLETCLQDCLIPRSDCYDIAKYGKNQTGVHTISPVDGVEMQVRCDMRHGGGWTVIQRRFDGSEQFDRDWETYKQGFGTPSGEYWIGNENLYVLTNCKTYELLVELTAHDGRVATAKYDSFRVTDESDKYRLILGTFLGGDAGDSLTFHQNMQFSTRDRDNDASDGSSCSANFGGNGGWWYAACDRADLNGGIYHSSAVTDDNSIEWTNFGRTEALKGSIMALRPSVSD